MSGDGGIGNRKLLTTGDNGFKLVTDAAYANMGIVNNTTGFAVTAAADPTLNTGSQYVLLTGAGAPFSSSLASNITFTTNRLIVSTNGAYELAAWCDISSFPSNTATVAFKFRINGSTISSQKVSVKSNSNGDHGSLVAFDFINLAPNDYVQLMIASDTTGNIVFENLNMTLKLIRAF